MLMTTRSIDSTEYVRRLAILPILVHFAKTINRQTHVLGIGVQICTDRCREVACRLPMNSLIHDGRLTSCIGFRCQSKNSRKPSTCWKRDISSIYFFLEFTDQPTKGQ